MSYSKSVLAGVAAALAAVTLAAIGGLAFINWRSDSPESTLVAFVFTSDQILLVAVVGCALGVSWSVHRQRRRKRE